MAGSTKCNHEESRLTCVDCGSAICSYCLVQCPVGFRCPKCSGLDAKKIATKTTTDGLIVARILLICVGLGYGFGMAEPYLDWPFVGVFVCLAAGMLIGRLCAPVVDDRRVARGLLVTITFGLLIGMSFTNLGLQLTAISQALCTAVVSEPAVIVPTASALLGFLFNPIAFLMGFLRASVWKM